MSQKVWFALVLSLALGGCPNAIVDEPPSPGDPGDGQDVSCEDDSDCGDRAICLGGLCADVGAGCVTKSECSPNQVCIAGTCGLPTDTCASSEECLGATMCDGFSRTCFDPNATGCQGPSDCALEPGCEDGCMCELSVCVPVGEEPGPGPGPTEPLPTGTPMALGGFKLENRETGSSGQVGVLPDGLSLLPGQRLVIARNATQSAFESFWGVDLDDDVRFLNAEAESTGVPIVNGGERWALVSPLGTVVDGTTIAGAKNRSYRRITMGSASDEGRWHVGSMSEAAPGDTSLPSSGVGLVISQWSDASTFAYEFIELYYAP